MFNRYQALYGALCRGEPFDFLERAAKEASYNTSRSADGSLLCGKEDAAVTVSVPIRALKLSVTGMQEGYLLFSADAKNPAALANKPVVFQNGTRGLVGIKNRDAFLKKKPCEVSCDDLFLDLGSKDAGLLAGCKTAYLDLPVSEGAKGIFLHPYWSALAGCLCALEAMRKNPNLRVLFTEGDGPADSIALLPCPADTSSLVLLGSGPAGVGIEGVQASTFTAPQTQIIGIPVRNRGANLEAVSESDLTKTVALLASLTR